MRDRVALTGVIGFCLGVLFASLYAPSWPLAGFLVLLGGVLLGGYVLKKRFVYAAASICMLAAALGIVRVAFTPLSLPDTFVPLLETDVTLEGIVIGDPDVRETNQRITLEVVYEGEKTNVLVVTELFPRVVLGERIQASGTLEVPEPFETTEGRIFRYDRFLAKDGIFTVLPFAKVEVLAPRETVLQHVRGFLSDIKPAFLGALGAALPEPESALAGGLIAGGKQGLGDTLEDAFIATGLIHIVVLSGYNVMIVAQFIIALFGALPARLKYSAAGITVLLFVLAAGAGAASIRAGLMALVALFARATNRVYDAIRALLVVGVLMLLINPLLVAYDPGFQLSFVATLGLILGAPITERWVAFVRLKFLREIISATIAAQIAVLPLLLYQTGLLSLIALPANVLVLPAVPLAMLLSFIAGLAGLLVPPLASVFGIPALAILWYIITFTETAANLPFAALTLPAFPFALAAAAYALLGFFVWKKRTLLSTPNSSHGSL